MKEGGLMKNRIILANMMLCIALICACGKEEENQKGVTNEAVSDIDRQIENGYDLPVSDDEREEAETDCKRMMELISDIYKGTDKGDSLNDTLSDEALYEMTEKIKEIGSPVRMNKVYSNLENYEQFKKFLILCTAGNSGTEVIYEIHSDGSIGREKYIYDGNDMYVVASIFTWGNDGKPVMSYISYSKINEWEYTDKGWFCYELCVPDYPEVTEVVDGSCMIRVKPMGDENRKISEKCVLGLAYQGNNLLCSNWDTEHMENLDYNGLYEYLYAMKYGKKFDSENYPNGIPKEEFEKLITEYLPITEKDIQRYAVFDEENQTYEWARLGCFNYTPDYFGTSFPEVTDIRENGDGTVTLTVDAVCEFMLCDDVVITHELTIRFFDDGSFKYLGNKIMNNGISDIPAYEYRISRGKPLLFPYTYIG